MMTAQRSVRGLSVTSLTLVLFTISTATLADSPVAVETRTVHDRLNFVIDKSDGTRELISKQDALGRAVFPVTSRLRGVEHAGVCKTQNMCVTSAGNCVAEGVAVGAATNDKLCFGGQWQICGASTKDTAFYNHYCRETVVNRKKTYLWEDDANWFDRWRFAVGTLSGRSSSLQAGKAKTFSGYVAAINVSSFDNIIPVASKPAAGHGDLLRRRHVHAWARENGAFLAVNTTFQSEKNITHPNYCPPLNAKAISELRGSDSAKLIETLVGLRAELTQAKAEMKAVYSACRKSIGSECKITSSIPFNEGGLLDEFAAHLAPITVDSMNSLNDANLGAFLERHQDLLNQLQNRAQQGLKTYSGSTDESIKQLASHFTRLNSAVSNPLFKQVQVCTALEKQWLEYPNYPYKAHDYVAPRLGGARIGGGFIALGQTGGADIGVIDEPLDSNGKSPTLAQLDEWLAKSPLKLKGQPLSLDPYSVLISAGSVPAQIRSPDDLNKIRNSAPHALIMYEGRPVAGTNPNIEGFHPRTIIGITKDRKTLMFFVIEGRLKNKSCTGPACKWEQGLDSRNLFKLLRACNIHTALNFDGGASSQFAFFKRENVAEKRLARDISRICSNSADNTSDGYEVAFQNHDISKDLLSRPMQRPIELDDEEIDDSTAADKRVYRPVPISLGFALK